LLVFNNGGGRKPEEFSSVDEFIPPTDSLGIYVRPEKRPFGPPEPCWSYTAPNKKDFFSWFISGVQRLPNGNTLINAGAYGFVFEVTPKGETVWQFANPFKPTGGGPPNPNVAPKRPDAAAQKTKPAEAKKDQPPPAPPPGRGAPRRQGNMLFRATRYALDHPAFAVRTLKPGKTLAEIQEETERASAPR
jgi:hypothetical protein